MSAAALAIKLETTEAEREELAQHLRYVNATGYGSDASVARYDAIQRDIATLQAALSEAGKAGGETEQDKARLT